MTEKDPKKVAAGLARAQALTPDQKRMIAEKAAAARWGRLFKATHKGNFKEEFGIDVECYVLDDASKTAVISQSGMARAIGLSPRGNAFPRFLTSRAISERLGADLNEKLQKPLKFQWEPAGAGQQPPALINGYDVTVLIDICRVILEAGAARKLTHNQEPLMKQASIITTASAKNGIKDLVYALAGYSPSAEEVINAFKLYVQEEARKYEQEFPNELYMQWHRLYEIPIHSRGKPWHFKHLTVRHIYFPLAKSNGKIFELVKALKAKDGDKQKKLFQFLNSVGARALRIQIGRVLEMSESSNDRFGYEMKIAERFGGQTELELVMPVSGPSHRTESGGAPLPTASLSTVSDVASAGVS